MKQKLLILILISILSFGCSNLRSIRTSSTDLTTIPSTSTPTLSLVDAAKSVQLFPQTYIEDITSYPKWISPSGEKIIIDNDLVNGMHYREKDLFTVSILETGTKPQLNDVEVQLDIPSTIYFIQSWATDEKAFAAIYYDVKYFNGSETCCGEAIAITNLNDENATTFTYHWGWNHTSQLIWSEDSSKVSVDFLGDHTPLVFNRNGELIKTFPQSSSPLFWSKDILYLIEKKDEVIQLNTYDFNSQESNLIMDDIIGYRYISHNRQKNQILVTKYVSAQIDTYEQINKFYVVDINQKSVEEVFLPETREVWSFHSAVSPKQDFVALKGKDKSMWIFNWNTYTFKYYGQIEDLFGWYKNTDGFLVTSLNNEQKIVKP